MLYRTVVTTRASLAEFRNTFKRHNMTYQAALT